MESGPLDRLPVAAQADGGEEKEQRPPPMKVCRGKHRHQPLVSLAGDLIGLWTQGVQQPESCSPPQHPSPLPWIRGPHGPLVPPRPWNPWNPRAPLPSWAPVPPAPLDEAVKVPEEAAPQVNFVLEGCSQQANGTGGDALLWASAAANEESGRLSRLPPSSPEESVSSGLIK